MGNSSKPSESTPNYDEILLNLMEKEQFFNNTCHMLSLMLKNLKFENTYFDLLNDFLDLFLWIEELSDEMSQELKQRKNNKQIETLPTMLYREYSIAFEHNYKRINKIIEIFKDKLKNIQETKRNIHKKLSLEGEKTVLEKENKLINNYHKRALEMIVGCIDNLYYFDLEQYLKFIEKINKKLLLYTFMIKPNFEEEIELKKLKNKEIKEEINSLNAVIKYL